MQLWLSNADRFRVVMAGAVGAASVVWFQAALAQAGPGCPCDGNVVGPPGPGQPDFVDISSTINCTLGLTGACNPLMDVDCNGKIDYCDVQRVVCRFQQIPAGVCCSDACGGCCNNGTQCANARASLCNGVYLGDDVLCKEQNAAIFSEGGNTVAVHQIGPDVDCTNPFAARARASCPPGGPYSDPWVTGASGSSCHNFGSADTDPIPAGFFDTGSDPFTGTVCLVGLPLGVPGFGDADTFISRTADPISRCALPGGGPSSVDIEIVQLSLVSTTPIVVTHNGGSNPEDWDVFVDLAPDGPQPGTPQSTLTATKTHCNGGTYTSQLYIQPRFTFTKVSDPGTQVVLDTRLTGTDPIHLVQAEARPWAVEVDPLLGYRGDGCSSFHPGITHASGTACDCNSNAQHDLCDLDQGIGFDCNGNSLLDSCDIATGRSLDGNLDTIPDECPAVGPSVGDDVCVGGANNGLPCSANADCVGGVCRTKNRFITTTLPLSATAHGVKVNVVSIDANSAASPANYEGTDRWAGAPLIGVMDGVSGTFNASLLQCSFHSQDWSAIGRLHMYSDTVVPGSAYDVSLCNPQTICSASLRIETARFGDVVTPTPTVNFQDVNSIVAKFQGTPAGPSKTRTKLTNSVVNPVNPINFQEVSACVSAFQSKPFKSVVTTPPGICP